MEITAHPTISATLTLTANYSPIVLYLQYIQDHNPEFQSCVNTSDLNSCIQSHWRIQGGQPGQIQV